MLAVFLALWAGIHGFRSVGADQVEQPGVVDYLEPAVLAGTIYATSATSNEVLFTFRRTAARSGSTVRVLREYTAPGGGVAARERIVYEAGNLVSFELEEPQSGASGSARVQTRPEKPSEPRITFAYTQDHKTKSGSEPLEPSTLINDMIGPFLAAHWDDLMHGSAVKFRYAAVTRAETVGFKFKKQSETTWRCRPAVVIRMEPTSWIIARLVEPLVFTAEKEGSHRILQYVGRTTPRIRKGNAWADLDAVTVFDWK
jgi:hypothetical protein